MACKISHRSIIRNTSESKEFLTKEEYYPVMVEDADSLVYHAGVTVFKSEFDGNPRNRYVLKYVVYTLLR
jgi:hypothetical protein